MKFPATVIEETASAKLLVFCVPDEIEVESLPYVDTLPLYSPTTLLFEAWYTTLKQGLDWRAGYFNPNPNYNPDPKGGTATYYFTVGSKRVPFSLFDKARRLLPDSFQRHLLDVAERKKDLRLEVAYTLWANFISLSEKR